MENGEDYDVIFEGSPLYDSLVQSGSQSLAEELSLEQHIEERKYSDDHESGLDAYTTTQVQNDAQSNVLQKVAGVMKPDFPVLERSHGLHMAELLMNSSLLEDGDAEFLHSYFKPVTPGPDSESRQSNYLWTVFYISAIPFVFSYLYTRCTSQDQFDLAPKLLGDVSILLISLLLSGRVWLRFCTWRYQRGCAMEAEDVQNLVSACTEFNSTCKKCIRLVQEMELVSRGFTLVSQQHPLSMLEGRHDDKGSRQCLLLRKLIFTINRAAVLVYRDVTQAVLNRHPIADMIDVRESYLAFTPLMSYGPCLQQAGENEEELSNLTDRFSISAIKVMFHLCTEHQSELIKALVLVYSNTISHTGNPLTSLIKQTHKKLHAWTGSLQHSHHFHSSQWQSLEPVTRTVRNQSATDAIQVAVHSLDLHLQAALTRVRSLSKLIQDSQSELVLKSCDLPTLMQPIKSELESCKGCWEEATVRMNSFLGNTVQASSTHQPAIIPAKINEEKLPEQSRSKSIEEYIIEDQVFEAYTDPNVEISRSTLEQPLTAEEKELKRLEQEEAKRVLLELKSVISVRAVDVKRREDAALHRMYPHLNAKERNHPSTDNDHTDIDSSKKPTDVNSKKGNQGHKTIFNSQKIPGTSSLTEEKNHQSETTGREDFKSDESKSELNQTLNQGDKVSNRLYTGHSVKEMEVEQSDYNSDHRLPSLSSVLQRNENRDGMSYVSRAGVRRLRKRNMLEMCDYDSDEDRRRNEPFDYYYNNESEDEDGEDLKPIRLGLPSIDLMNVSKLCNKNSVVVSNKVSNNNKRADKNNGEMESNTLVDEIEDQEHSELVKVNVYDAPKEVVDVDTKVSVDCNNAVTVGNDSDHGVNIDVKNQMKSKHRIYDDGDCSKYSHNVKYTDGSDKNCCKLDYDEDCVDDSTDIVAFDKQDQSNNIDELEYIGVRRPSDGEEDSDDQIQLRLPSINLEQRMQKIAGNSLGFSSALAAQVVARAKAQTNVEEETLCGYGERSEESDTDETKDMDS